MKILQNWNLCHGFAARFAILGEMSALARVYSVLNTVNNYSSGLVIQMTSALQLDGLVTKKPRVSKYTMKPQAVNPTSALFHYAS